MALVDSNAFVSMSSSADQDYPPSNILDPWVFSLQLYESDLANISISIDGLEVTMSSGWQQVYIHKNS